MDTGFKYLPFMSGLYSTAPGLKILDKAEHPDDKLVFQIDDQYDHYLSNKKSCRDENLAKYYLESDLKKSTIQSVNQYILARLVSEHSSHFSLAESVLHNQLTDEKIKINNDWKTIEGNRYHSLFDALSSQVQEDIAVFQLTEDADYLSAIHLCAPNHWSPADKIGQPFDTIHRPVAGMEETIKRYPAMLQSIVDKKGPFTRFAWGLGTDDRLNHHPTAPTGIDSTEWNGRSVVDKNTPIFLRLERQNLIGFPKNNAFMFTIRTYFYDVNELTKEQQKMLWLAISSMSPENRTYKGLVDLMPMLEKKLG